MKRLISKISDNKIALYTALALIIIGALVGYIYINKQSTESDTKITDDNNTIQKSETPKSNTGTSNSNLPTQNISYSQATKNYLNKSIQFDENCLASPSYGSFRSGENIMLDNRGSSARSIYLDGKEYKIGAYDFKIVTLATTNPLPHTIMVDCGNGKNNARILLQQ